MGGGGEYWVGEDRWGLGSTLAQRIKRPHPHSKLPHSLTHSVLFYRVQVQTCISVWGTESPQENPILGCKKFSFLAVKPTGFYKGGWG